MAEDESPLTIKKVESAQSYIKEHYSDTIGLATSILGQVLLGTVKGSKRNKQVIKLCLKDMPHQFRDRVAENPRNEIAFMNKICNVSHPNFVRFIEAVEDKKLFVMRLEYISGGDMCTYLQNLNSGLGSHRAKKYAIQLTKAVYFMHFNGYCHLDISLENVLWDKATDTVKLCDFGLSRKFPQNGDVSAMFNAATVRPGKKGYMSPEIYAYQRFNGMKSDVFSLGVLIFILLTGFPPFTTPNASDKCFQFMYYGKLEWLLKQWKLNEIIDSECRDLLSKIFCHPKKRISIKQMLEHEWMSQSVADVEEEMLQYQIRQMPQMEELEVERSDSSENKKEEKEKEKKQKIIKKKRKLSAKTQKHKRKKKASQLINMQKVGKIHEISTKNRSKSISMLTLSQTLLSEFGATVRCKSSETKRTRSKSLQYTAPISSKLKIRRRSIHLNKKSHSSSSDRDSSSHSDGTHSNQSSFNDDHKSSPSNSPRNSANKREQNDPAPIVNDTQSITKKLKNMHLNNGNGNFGVNDFDNDRKEGDYETYPNQQYHERNCRNLSITSQESAGSVHSNHSDSHHVKTNNAVTPIPITTTMPVTTAKSQTFSPNSNKKVNDKNESKY